MKKLILDSSFVCRSVLAEESSAALTMEKILREEKAGKVALYSSNLFFLEMGNALRFSQIEQNKVEIFLETILKFPIEYFSFKKKHIMQIVELSFDLDTTVYDTSYHFLAKLLGGVFLTCDKKYFEKAREIGNIEFID